MNKEILVILQVRTGSTRLPGKAMLLVNDSAVILWQIKRVMRSAYSPKIVVATTTSDADDDLADLLQSNGILVYRGSETNVFSRYLDIIKQNPHEIIVRLTGDCPLFMPEIFDSMLELFTESQLDLLTNTFPPTFPDGLDIEIASREAFIRLSNEELSRMELEHVTLGFYNRHESYRINNFSSDCDRSELRWTLDYLQDFEFIFWIYGQFIGREVDFNYEDIIEITVKNQKLGSTLNAAFRNIALSQNLEKPEGQRENI